MFEVNDIDFSNNQLTGSLPSWLGSLYSLQYFPQLRGNEITGSLPESVGDLVGIRNLNVSGFGLVGTIPASIGSMGNHLSSLYVHTHRHTDTHTHAPNNSPNPDPLPSGICLGTLSLEGYPRLLGAWTDLPSTMISHNLCLPAGASKMLPPTSLSSGPECASRGRASTQTHSTRTLPSCQLGAIRLPPQNHECAQGWLLRGRCRG